MLCIILLCKVRNGIMLKIKHKYAIQKTYVSHLCSYLLSYHDNTPHSLMPKKMCL